MPMFKMYTSKTLINKSSESSQKSDDEMKPSPKVIRFLLAYSESVQVLKSKKNINSNIILN